MKAATPLALIALLGATPATATITVGGAFVHQETLATSDVAKMSHIAVTSVEHDGTTSHYSGVPLAQLLHDAGAPVGDDVKGAPARSYVAVEGSDGYVALYSLAELDTTAGTCAPILADQRDGANLPASIGPYHIVAPCDRNHARWVRNVTSITIVTVPDGKQ
jgi:hypothetical protein